MKYVTAEELAAWEVVRERRKDFTAKAREMFSHPFWPGQGNFTPESCAAAYRAGLLPAAGLVDGRYYYGHCRNARVARWDAARQVFTYMRSKFGSAYPEDIRTVENDDGYDLFLPVAEIDPEPGEVVPG